jgi:hypothetical protein
MKTKTEKPWESRSQKGAKMTGKKLKKAVLDIFSEKSVDAAMTGKILGR